MYENMMYNPALMPYMGMQQPAQHIQKREILRCNGENGALSIQLAPNESVLAIDNSGKILWAVIADAIGNKTASPFDIYAHVDAPEPNLSDLESRIAALERMMNDAKHTGLTESKQSGTADYTAYTANQTDDRRDQKRK